jgi:VWFA-related protein
VPSPAGETVFRSGVELVALNVIVTDTSQRFVSNLLAHDFEVLEDGTPQPISFFASGQVPLDLVLLIDTSASMGLLRPTVQRSARDFLGVLRPEDRGAVAGFNERVTVLQDLTSDIAALDGAVRRAGASGDTALYTSLYVALRRFGRPARQASEVRRQAIVVVTDGEENTSGLGFEALEEEARSRGVALYAIMLQTDTLLARERLEGRLRPARAAIRQLAVETGALAYFPRSVKEIPGICQAIAAELTNQYSIAYQPIRTGRDRTLHHVAVRVASRPALRARTRTNYLPSGAALQLAGLR